MADDGKGMVENYLLMPWNAKGEEETGCRKEQNGNDDAFNNDDIKIATATGKIISLKVKDSETIGGMKLKIQDEERIPFDQQELIFNGTVLDNMNALANLSIKKESTLTLVRRPRGLMNIFVVVPHEKTYSLEVNPSDTVSKVKSTMFGMRGMMFTTRRDMLIFNGIVLEDTATLADFKIINGSTLTFISGSEVSMEIFVNILAGKKTIALSVKPTDTIAHVKSKIKSQEDIPRDEQALIFNKMVLGDSGTLSDFQINKKSTLTLMRKSTGFIEVFIETFTGQIITLKVNPRDTIDDVKEEIENETDVPSDEMELIYNDMVLDDNAKLADFQITNGSTLTLMRLSTGFMVIYIKTLTGKIIDLEVKPSYTISHVKYQIRGEVGVSPCELIFNGKRLQDRPTLADYQINKESTLHLISTKGGMKKV